MTDTDARPNVLLVTAIPLTRDDLLHLPALAGLDGAAVHVLAPSLNDSALAYWVSDPDDAIAEARTAAEVTTTSLASVDVARDRLAGSVGDSDPIVAIGDVLREFPAERIVTVYRQGDDASHLEDRLRREVLARAFGLPVDAYPLDPEPGAPRA